MKKLFTSLVAVFCAMAGMAQTLTFSHDGVAIENGSTFYSRDVNEKLLPFGVTKFEPEIDLSSDVAANVYVSIQSLDEVSVELCAIDGTCVTTDADKGYVAQKNGEWTANEVVDMQIHWNAGALQAGCYHPRCGFRMV